MKKEEVTDKQRRLRNKCWALPRTIIKYINMQTSLCPFCNPLGIKRQASAEHFERRHEIDVSTTRQVIDVVRKAAQQAEYQWKKKKKEEALCRVTTKEPLEKQSKDEETTKRQVIREAAENTALIMKRKLESVLLRGK